MGIGHGGGISAAPDLRQGDELLVVLVLSHDKREHTLRCLASVAALRYRPREVVVVDNGSADSSADAIAAAHPGVHLVRSADNLGAAGGRNLGIRYAARFPWSYLLLLDDDAQADEQLADALVAALRADPKAGLATPKAYRTDLPGVIASAGGMRIQLGRGSIVDIGAGQRDTGQFDRPGYVDSCVGFAVLIRRDALDAVVGLDEAYNPYGWEEVDLSLRARRAGYAIRYVPSAIAYHAGGIRGRGRPVPEYERGKTANYLRLMRRHATPLEWLGFAVAAPARAVVLLIRDLARGQWRAAAARVRGVIDSARSG
ncbi:MAG TPA: glycosyltransferase family 2 protein [Gemmatimonadales bacterium]|nr:glycosyltransferase family 2 protein [Gemmatimonadales bacterium]